MRYRHSTHNETDPLNVFNGALNKTKRCVICGSIIVGKNIRHDRKLCNSYKCLAKYHSLESMKRRKRIEEHVNGTNTNHWATREDRPLTVLLFESGWIDDRLINMPFRFTPIKSELNVSSNSLYIGESMQ